MSIRYQQKLEVQRANKIPDKAIGISKITVAIQELVNSPGWLQPCYKREAEQVMLEQSYYLKLILNEIRIVATIN